MTPTPAWRWAPRRSGVAGDCWTSGSWRLLDRVPVLAVGRDDRRDSVAVGVVLAAAVVFRACPFSIPILAMKRKPSKSLSSAVRALRASGLVSLGLIPRADSRIARNFPREISAALHGRRSCRLMIMRSQSLRFTCGPSTTTNSHVEHFAAAVLGALEQPTLAGPAGADRELHGRDRVGRDQFVAPLLGGVGVVVRHS